MSSKQEVDLMQGASTASFLRAVSYWLTISLPCKMHCTRGDKRERCVVFELNSYCGVCKKSRRSSVTPQSKNMWNNQSDQLTYISPQIEVFNNMVCLTNDQWKYDWIITLVHKLLWIWREEVILSRFCLVNKLSLLWILNCIFKKKFKFFFFL